MDSLLSYVMVYEDIRKCNYIYIYIYIILVWGGGKYDHEARNSGNQGITREIIQNDNKFT